MLSNKIKYLIMGSNRLNRYKQKQIIIVLSSVCFVLQIILNPVSEYFETYKIFYNSIWRKSLLLNHSR